MEHLEGGKFVYCHDIGLLTHMGVLKYDPKCYGQEESLPTVWIYEISMLFVLVG